MGEKQGPCQTAPCLNLNPKPGFKIARYGRETGHGGSPVRMTTSFALRVEVPGIRLLELRVFECLPLSNCRT
jgi:hypothetical protein